MKINAEISGSPRSKKIVIATQPSKGKSCKRAKYEFKVVRVGRLHEKSPALIDSQRIVDFWNGNIQHSPMFQEEKEHLVVLVLNTKLEMKGWNVVSVGTINECLASPREIFRPAVILSAYAIVLMHNHPSGDPTPSEGDNRITEIMRQAGALMEICLLDHVIVGSEGRFFSYHDAGLIS